MPAIEKASALVVEEGGLTSHAVVAIAQNIPVIVGAADATSLINNDEVITVILVVVLFTAEQQQLSKSN